MILRRIGSHPNWPTAFGDLEEMRRGVERLFGALADADELKTAGVFPAVNVADDLESVFVRAELPGIDRDDLEVTVNNGTLTIAGERAMPVEEKGTSYHRREREWGSFRRSISVPVDVVPDQVRAAYRDGILTVTMPKAPESKPKRIAVQADA